MAARGRPALVATGLFVASLALRLLVLGLTPFPAYPDAEYYVAAAREIAAGHGALIPYLWAFVEVGGGVPAHGVLPLPAFGHWMPLASFVQVPFIWLLGPSDLASAVPFVIAGAALAPFTYLLGRDLFPDHPALGLAGTLAVVPAASGYLSQPDNYALYALLGAGALWLTARTLTERASRPALELIAAGLLAGLAFLARTDGFLVAGALGVAVLVSRRPASRRWLGGAALACVAIVGPWEARNLAVFGTFSESAASGRVLWIRDFAEHFGADGPLAPSHLLSWGLGPLIWSRVVALGDFAALAAVGLLALVQLPPAVAGAWSLRRRTELMPFAVWAVLFALWSILIVPAPFIVTGNFLHSALVLLPLACLCTALGVGRLVTAVGGRRGWTDLARRTRFWQRAVVMVTAVAAVASVAETAVTWNLQRGLIAQGAAWLEANAPPAARVMSVDPGALYALDGRTGIQTPESDLAVIRRAVRAYDVTYLLLEADSIVPALQPVLTGSARPPWLSAPLFSVPAVSGGQVPRLAIYAVDPAATPP